MKNLICDSEPLVLQEELVVSSANVDTNQAFAYLESQIIGNLNLSVVNSASGRPVSHALISIDDIRKTAICGPCGKVSLNDLNSGKYLLDIIWYGLSGEEYVDFSDLAEKACELLWNREEKNYENALMVLRNENHELIPGLSNEFVLKIVQEAKELDLGYEEDKEELENFVSEAGIK